MLSLCWRILCVTIKGYPWPVLSHTAVWIWNTLDFTSLCVNIAIGALGHWRTPRTCSSPQICTVMKLWSVALREERTLTWRQDAKDRIWTYETKSSTRTERIKQGKHHSFLICYQGEWRGLWYTHWDIRLILPSPKKRKGRDALGDVGRCRRVIWKWIGFVWFKIGPA